MQLDMAKRLKIHADDSKGTLSVSAFIHDMPGQLCWSDNKSIFHLKLFWDQDRLVPFSTFAEKIKSALERLDVFQFPTLVQLWAPRKIGSQQFLVTSELPFGINLLRKGLCLYRNLCLEYKYCLEGNQVLGPVGRVFRNGFPEFSPYVECYSSQEFELRDCAVNCGVYGHLALPVFDAAGKECVCVLELITVWDGNYYLTDTIWKVPQALEAAGLRTPNFHRSVDMEMNSRREFSLSEIEKGLKAVCEMHSISFAQTWSSSTGENNTETVMCTSQKGSHVLQKKFSSFQKDCITFGLKKGQGLVWRAFTNFTSCFCKDIQKFSVDEYPLVLSARKVGLTVSFAICLRNTFKGNEVYVLEFFPPFKQTIYSEPTTYLSALLATVEQHIQGFKVASRQEQSIDGTFHIINLDKDDRRSANVTNNTPFLSPDEDGAVKALKDVALGYPTGREHESAEVSIPTEGLLYGKHGFHLPSSKRKTDHSFSQQYKKVAKGHIAKSYEIGQECSPALRPENGRREDGIAMVIKASYKDDIIKFQFSLLSGLMDLENEINKRLKLAPGSFEIKYQNEHQNTISLANDAELHKLLHDMVSEGKSTVRLLLEPAPNQCIDGCTIPQSPESIGTITIKATYKEDTTQFELPRQSGLLELKDEVMKRLELKGDSFEIRHVDENNKSIPVCNDADLQNCLATSRSLGRQTLTLLLEPVTDRILKGRDMEMQNGSRMIIKATYKEDTIKFQLSTASGMMELKNEVAKRLKLSRGSFKVKYEDGVDGQRVELSGDADLQNHLSSMALAKRCTVKFHLEPVEN